MKVPFLNLPDQIRPLKRQIMAAWEKALDKGQFVLSAQVAEFERACAKFLGCRHAIAVNSGTDALVIGLRGAGIGAGDEVATTGFSFFATAEAISLVGAMPLFCDIQEDNFLLDLKDLKRKFHKRVKAILPVHLYGLPQSMKELVDFARSQRIAIIEDACQAFGARSADGLFCGTHGHFGAFSFYPTKNLGAAGDAGLVVCNDDELAKAARELRNHGSEKRYYHETLGYCSRMDGLQASVLLAKLPRLKKWNLSRQKIARLYFKRLEKLKGLRLPVWDSLCVWHQFTIRVAEGRRDRLSAFLDERGISTMVFYPVPIHCQKPYLFLKASLPIAEKASGEVLSLPIYPEMSIQQADYVCSCILEFFEK